MTQQNNRHSKTAGMTAGIIACVLATLGILFIGTIFVPLAIVTAICGSVISIYKKSIAGIGINILAWVLIVFGFATSPVLMGLIIVSNA
jgi:hypothetical protein